MTVTSIGQKVFSVFMALVMVLTLQMQVPSAALAADFSDSANVLTLDSGSSNEVETVGANLYVPITINPGSFNRDVVVEEGGSAESFTEGGTAYALYSKTGQAGSLPADGKIWTSDTSWFQLAGYAGNNVRRTLATAGFTVDIAEESQKEYTDVVFLITGSYVEDPHTKFRVRLHFVDAEGNPQIRDSEQFTLYNYNSNRPEWGANSAFSGGCYDISGQAYNPGREAHLYAYQMHIPGPGEEYDYSGCKLTGVEIREITMSKSYDGQVSTLSLFAVSGLEREPSYFQVKFDANGGALDADKDTVIGKVGKDITLPGATRAGYKLAGWYEDDESAIVGKADDAYTVAGNAILKAKWEEADDVIVSFDGNGGTGSMEDVVVPYNSTYTLPENEFGSPEDPYMYNFSCWNVNGKDYNPGDKITVAADTTVKAVWNVRYWGLWVENIHVSGMNYKDILAEHSKPGTVSYDPETNTLTLNNATIQIVPYAGSSDNPEAGIRYNAQQDEYKAMPFAINLVGENRIVNEVIDEGANDREEKYGILTFDCMSSTIITGAGSLDISMEATPGQTSGGKAYKYYGIHMRKNTVIDGVTVNINIAGDGAQAHGFGMRYTNTLSLENGAKLAITTGGYETSYGMWADRAGKLYSVDEKSVLEVASGNLAFNSIHITDTTAELGALVNTEPTASGAKIWDGETDLNSEEAGYKYIRIPGDHECADYIDPSSVGYTWSGDNSKATATGTCLVCGESVTETVSTTSEVTKQATCTEKGTTKYTATFENSAFKTQTKEVENIDASGHSWGEWVVTTPATADAEGVETRTCTVCGEAQTRTIPKLTTYSITYNPAGGTFRGSTSPLTISYTNGETITIPEAPTRDGYTFVYWQGSEYQPGDSYIVVEDHTFTAVWEKANNPDDKDSDDSDDSGSGGTDPDDSGSDSTDPDNSGSNDNTNPDSSDSDNGGSDGSSDGNTDNSNSGNGNAGGKATPSTKTSSKTTSTAASKTATAKTSDQSHAMLWVFVLCASLVALGSSTAMRRKMNMSSYSKKGGSAKD